MEPSRSRLRLNLSGVDFFRRMMSGELSAPPLVRLLGLRLIEVDEGRVVFAGTPSAEFYNGLGVAHGGFAATMLDSALGCAVNSMLPAGRLMTTLELKINYIRPLRAEVGEVRCEAKAIHVGARTGTAEGRILDAAGKIYAFGTTTCIAVG
ncbi:MAG TPA: PaaI family thioesterase [Vicinamibacterales bacterium]|jgi:uncharacterized protein (TIGR00369 family)|nr:PaaI family thioesterase [Vicinamibacterales bacterium]